MVKMGTDFVRTYHLQVFARLVVFNQFVLGIVVDSVVLDCTEYITKHPGGRQIVQGFGGQDCSWQWWTFHNRKIWNDVAVGLRVVRTEGIENRHVKPKSFIGLRGLGYQDDW